MLLEGKVCIVTGSARGIGAAIIERFAAEGAIVYANARSEGTVDAAASALTTRYPGEVHPLYYDVRDTKGLKEAVLRVKKEQGRLDAYVNNAGIMEDALIGMISNDLIQRSFETNVYSVIESMQISAKLMMRQKSGSIINVSSLVGVNGNKGQVVYSATKGAVISMTKSAAKELAPSNIRVNAIAPGMVDTDLFKGAGEEAVERFTSQIPMGRVGTTEEIADVCVFLASDLSRYVTGQVIGVDGAALM